MVAFDAVGDMQQQCLQKARTTACINIDMIDMINMINIFMTIYYQFGYESLGNGLVSRASSTSIQSDFPQKSVLTS